MAEADSTLPTVAAQPDTASSPPDAKKAKLLHVEPADGDLGHGDVGCSSAAGDPAIEGGTPLQTAVALPDTVDTEGKEEFWDLKMSWSGKVYEMRVGSNDMIFDFRSSIEQLTNVPPARQKIVGLGKGKLDTKLDSSRFGSLEVKKGGVVKFTLIGTPEAMALKEMDASIIPEIYDDFDVSYADAKAAARAVLPADDPRNKRKIQEMIQKCPITVMNEPREGKKLLVLDLDYTLVDTKPLIEGSLPTAECARPGMHEFLEAVYLHYDIVIWSQTHWRWLESKLVELGVIGGPRNYKICFVADRTSMFPVFTQRNGQPYKHEVKPLAYFWAKFPQWSARNTVHIDDLSRNFAMNPGEGLKIRAYNNAKDIDGQNDRELDKLAPYLVNLATQIDDFSTVNHLQWKASPLRGRRA